MNTNICEFCGKEARNAAGLSAHKRGKHREEMMTQETEPVIFPSTTTTTSGEGFTINIAAPVVSGPAILPNLPRATNLKFSSTGREIKLLRPICSTCQRGKGYPWDWWKRCQHSPYVKVASRSVDLPRYEPEIVDGNPTGRNRLMGTDTFEEPIEVLNWMQISAFPRLIGTVNKVAAKRAHFGFIFPHELRTPGYPNGIADPCEFRDCFYNGNPDGTTDIKTYRWGRFCMEMEARLVGFDYRQDGGGGALEVGDNAKSLEKMQRQLEEVPI